MLLLSCGGHRAFTSPPQLPDDRQYIPEPEEREYSWVADGFDKIFTDQLEQSFDLSRQFRHLFSKPKQAYNVDAFDEIPNSSWFTNRNGIKKMSLDEIRKGPDTCDGPDTSGKWIVTRAKAEGVTPGFHIKDKHGNRYVIKFDPKGYPELATASEVISTKLFYAMGYFTPENYITYFNPKILEVGDNVKFTDANGKKRRMTDDDLKALIGRIEVDPDGLVRAVASKYIPGIPKGPFAYEGIRKDDYNDYIPHQHRRELRSLYVTTSWLNHTDTKSGNSFDSYITEDGISYIRHYLIDFGTTLGSGARGPNPPTVGHENSIDPQKLLVKTVALGMYYPYYEKNAEIKFNSIGLFDASNFYPGKFKSMTPNPAFDNMTYRDAFWGAKLVMSFTDDQLEAVIKEGRYSDPEAEAYLFEVLKQRRDKIGRYWFSKINPLDNFRIENVNGKWQLCFDDLMVDYGFESLSNTKYKIMFKADQYESVIETAKPCAELSGPIDYYNMRNPSSNNSLPFGYCEVKILTFRKLTGKWSKWIKGFIVYRKAELGNSAKVELLGIEREE